MKTFKSNRKNTGAAGVASKACAWILSIMLVVTGMAPSFATNDKAGKDGALGIAKATAGAKATSKTKEVVKDNVTSKTKTVKKPATSKKDVSSSSKKQKSPKDKDDKNGKKKKFKNKGRGYFDLNEKGNVYAVFFDADQRLSIYVSSDPDGETDTYIEREKWLDMASKLGANFNDGYTFWANSQVKSINFDHNYDYNANLPSDSSYFFAHFKGEITGCQYLDVSGVTNMKGIFSNIRIANPDVSNWYTSNVTNTESMFEGASRANPDISRWGLQDLKNAKNMFNASGAKRLDLSESFFSSEFLSNEANSHAMFDNCSSLEYLKTYAGLKTSISGANSDFKIVKLKKGNAPVIENESQNLYSSYIINSSGDKENVYHIYRKDKYAHVIFDKNGGDKEGWINHEIVEKGKSINESGGSLPAKEPVRFGYKFNGWSKIKNATAPDFDADAQVNTYATVYAVYKEDESYLLNYSGNVMAKPNTRGDLIISAKDTSGNMNIEGHHWNIMRKALGGSEDSWENSRIKNIKFNTNGIYLLPKNSEYFFRYCEGEIEGCENLNTSNVINMHGMFSNTTLANPKVANWDVSKVTNIEAMFYYTDNANPDVSKWNTSKVTSMGYVFGNAKLANPNVSNWKTASVKSMMAMFADTSVANPDVSKWDTSNVSDMRFMFSGAILANPDVSNWDVSSVTVAYHMFSFSKSANPDVSKWNVSKMTEMDFMFKGSAVKNLNLSKWKLNQELVGNDKATLQMFRDCMNIESLRTPEGLKTDISGANNNFKIVKLKRGNSATIEKNNQNLNAEYVINKDGDSGVMYNIYRKDKWAGVTFNPNDGDDEAWVNHEILEKGKSIKESGGNLPAENPKLLGDEFLGWSTKRDINTSMFDENTKVNEDTTVYALWKKKQKVNVTFDSNGGSGSMDTAHVDKGGNFVLPISSFIPPADQEFDRWSVTVGSAQPVDKKPGESIVASDNVLVKAVWKAKTVNINFNANSGTGDMAAVEVNKGANYRLPECTFTPPVDKVFDKWSVVIGSAQPVDKNPGDEIVASDNVTVTAKWKAKPIPKVNITFNGNSGTGSMDVVQVDKGSSYTLPISKFTPPAGMEFDKWSVTVGSAPAVDKQPGESITASDNVTVIAIWKNKPVPKVNITFNANGGSGSMNATEVEKGKDYTLPVCTFVPPAGKEFDRWSVTVGSAPAVDKQPGESIVASDNVLVKAVWKAKTVNINFNANSGTGDMAAVEVNKGANYRLPECTFTPPVDKVFDKWSVVIGSAQPVDKNPGDEIVASDNVTVTAKWKAKPIPKVNITFNGNSGTGSMDVVQVDKGSSYTLPISKFTPPAGMEFDKWSVTVGSAPAVDKQPGESVTASDNVAVKAMWKTKTLPVMAKVTLYAEGVAGYPQVIEVKRGETLGDKLPAKIEKAGYDFLGYSKENNGDINFFSDTAVKEDVNVYAVYKSNAPVAKKVEAIRLTAGSLRMQLGDLTDVLAIVSPSDATDKRVKFTLDREDIIKIVSADDSAARVEAIGEGRVKVKAEAFDGSGVTGEITIEVVRKPAKKVQVKLNAEGVAGYPKTLETEEGTSLDANLPMDLKKDGYIFRGWSYEKNGEVNFTKHTQVSKNVEIHAVFKKDEVSALFIAEGAAGFPKSVMVERGKKIGDKLPANPARTGYDFEGWSTESSLGTVNLTKDTVIDKDTIVYAVFKKQGAIVKQVSSITLGVTKSNIKAGDEADVIASILPADADDKRLSWESSAPDKLKIEQTGDNFIRIKAEEEGTYTITAKAKDGSNVEANIEIKVLSKISAPISNKVKVMISADGVADYPKLIEIDKNTTLHGKLPTDINKPGYKFKGFTKTMGNAADFDDNEVIKEDTRLYAVFEQTAAPTKKVTGIELSKSKSKVAVGDTVDILPSITPEDADNKALDYTIDKKDNALIYKNPDGTLRLYAMSKGKVMVTAKATDGSNVTKPIEIEITEAEKEQVTITLNADGINGYPKQLTVDKGEALGNALPNVLDKADYDFRGWSTTPGGIIDVNRLTPMTSSISIYAVFTKKQVNVRMLAEGVNGYPKNVSLDIHSTLGSELPASLNKEGYTFKGWSKDSFTGAVNVTAATKIDESMTIYAVFERQKPVTQKVESIKIEDVASEKKVVGKEFDLLANILPQTADDKTLEWSASDPAVKIVQKQNNLVSVTVSAAGNYSITAKAKDGSNIEDTFAFTVEVAAPDVRNVKLEAEGITGYPKTIKVNKGEALTGRLPMDLEKDGYTFLGWSKTQGAAEADFDASLPVTDDITLYAVFKKNVAPPAPGKTRVTLDGNGGVLAGGAQANIDIESGDTIKTQLESAVANTIFTKPGYKFIGFSRSKFATAADYNLDSPVYTDMTLYAVYEEAPVFTDVTIKYDIFDMENVVIENVAEGKPIGSKLDGHVKQRDGYRFLGFAKTQDAVKPDFFRKSIVTNGLVLYPVYKEVGKVDKVNVAFKLNDGTDASLKSEEVIRYESLGDKMPTKDKALERDGYLFTGWAKSKAAKYSDFFRSTTVKGDMTVYAVWKSLYDERLGQAVLKVAAKAKGYELTIEPPKANLHTGFEIFRSEKKDFKPSKDNKIATIDRNTLKYLDEKADNGKAYYYAVRAIDADGSYNGTKVTYIGKLSDKVLAAPLPKDKGVTATVAGKGAVDLEFNKTMAAAGYKVTVTAPYDKKFKAIERFVKADKLVAAGADKVKASVTGLPMGKFLAFKLEALEADNSKLVEYGNSFAFMLGAVEKLSAKVNKKSRVLNIKFKAMKGVNGYEAKIVIGGKVKTIKLKKGKKKLNKFMVGSIKLPKKKGNYTFTIRAFKKIGKLKYFGQAITKVVR